MLQDLRKILLHGLLPNLPEEEQKVLTIACRGPILQTLILRLRRLIEVSSGVAIVASVGKRL